MKSQKFGIIGLDYWISLNPTMKALFSKQIKTKNSLILYLFYTVILSIFFIVLYAFVIGKKHIIIKKISNTQAKVASKSSRAIRLIIPNLGIDVSFNHKKSHLPNLSSNTPKGLVIDGSFDVEYQDKTALNTHSSVDFIARLKNLQRGDQLYLLTENNSIYIYKYKESSFLKTGSLTSHTAVQNSQLIFLSNSTAKLKEAVFFSYSYRL